MPASPTVRYLGKLFVPVRPSPSFIRCRRPEPGRWRWCWFPAAYLLCVITALVVMRMRRQPYLFTGWFWYLGTLLPVIGLMQVGIQSMADRYTYVPMIGITLALTWGACDLARGWRPRKFALPAIAAVALACCAWLTLRQIAWWKDSETIFRRTIAVTSSNPVAQLNLGCALADRAETGATRQSPISSARTRITRMT